MSNLLQNGELMLYGTVGLGWWNYFTANDVMAALYSLDPEAPVTVRINSGGGDICDGIAIANMLKAHPGEVTCIIDAVAASAASIIALGGDKLIMRPGTLLMIHDPCTYAEGNVSDLTNAADMLETFAQAMASIYAGKTGQTVADARAAMKTETWYGAEDALAAKLCDEIGQPLTGSGGVVPMADDDVDPTEDGDEDEDGEGGIDIDITIVTPEAAAFDYRIYAKAPQVLADLAAARNWTAKTRSERPAASKRGTNFKPKPKGSAMTTNPQTPAGPAQTQKPGATASVAAEIADYCTAEGVAVMASALIREGVSLEDAKTRVAGAKEIRAAVDLARRSCPQIEASKADAYIAAGTSIETVRAELFKTMTAVQAHSQVSNTLQPGGIGSTSAPVALDIGAVYATFNKRAAS